MPDNEANISSPHLRSANNVLQAELWLTGQAPRSCTLSKVANNNLIFLTVTSGVDTDSHLPLQQQLADLMILDGDSSQPLRIRTRISHHTRERWVLEPLQSSLPLLPLLKKALQNGAQSASTTNQNLAHIRRGEILRGCRRIITRYLSECYAVFYSDLDDALFIAAATSSDSKNEFLSAVRLIEQSHTQLEHGFIERVCWLIDAATEPDFEPTDADNQKQTASVGRLNLEVLSKRAASLNEQALDKLAQRFSSIVLRLCDDATLPFGPAWLCRHFGDSIAAMDLSTQTQQLVYRVFRDTILTGIDALYEQLNGVFIQYQVLPGLELSPLQKSIRKPAAEGIPGPGSKNTGTSASACTTATRWENGDKDAGTRQLFDATCRLWTTKNRALTTPLSPGAAALSTTEVLTELAALSSAADVGRAQTIGQSLLARLDVSAPGRLHPDTRASIAVADELLSILSASEQIPDPARPLLQKLATPFLRAALLDPGFFSKQQHPARQSLNLIARLCRQAHFNNAMVRRQLQGICERILQESHSNPNVFGAVLTPLRGLAARQQQACGRNINRVAATQDAQYQLNRAHAKVDEQLYQHFAGKVFPQILLELLDSGWHKLMIHSLLKNGDHSSQWQGCLAALHDLYYSLLPAQQRRSSIGRWTPIKAEAIPSLLQKPLEQLGIATIQYQTVVQRLAATLEDPTQTLVLPDYPHRKSGKDTPGTVTEAPAGRWINRCRELKAGDWLGWIDNPLDEPLQFAWVASDYSRYVLVNEQGHQLFDWPCNTLAINMQHGLQQLSNPGAWPAVDNGLYEIAQSLYQQLVQTASLDPLTGLLNQSAFESQLAEHTKLACHSETSHALIGVEIDRFATISDCGVPQSGEQLLRNSAALIASLCPHQAIVARIEAHCIGILLPGRNGDYAQELAENLRQTLQRSDALTAHNTSASLGIVAVTGDSSCTTTLLKQLQNLIQQGQNSGGNRVLWQGDTDQQLHQKHMLEWITLLGEILEQDRLRLRCQAIVPLSENAGIHHEILLGVAAADGSIMLPGELIAAAEQYNRMDIIDRWVILRTCQWLRRHPEKATQLGRIHINLSGNSIGNDLFLNFLLAELDRGSLPREQFCFEIMETAAITNLPKAADFIARVQARGCKFALDNFGRGTHSLDYLRKLPVDYIKIDGSLVAAMNRDPASADMLDAINRIAHVAGKPTIAVCVENEGQLQALENMGVDYAQGFGVAKPTLLSEA
jgi:diguanylate cyclase (GGDEF)-like protein